MSPLTVRTVVLDIEGTTGSADHVHHVLFPYARQRLAGWFADQRGTARHAEVLEAVRATASDPLLDEAGAVAALAAWADSDTKAAPLKTVQGLIWAQGYADGSLTGHVYPDVPPALRRWAGAEIEVYVYSSGSLQAQRDWFRYSDHGDLTGLLRGHFDLESAGPKRAPDSYRAITRAVGGVPGDILFLSDVAAELDAAAVAGWRVLGVRRPGDPDGPQVPGHPTVTSLDDVPLTTADRGAGPTPRPDSANEVSPP
ncbi:acireductone synthase [Streptomyces sp. NPDC059740]|uniref:acireductone synthase n=1 Tax=Streptomyces sp. NPDC059740 TaxID=3346926 RepID=UPI00366692B5